MEPFEMFLTIVLEFSDLKWSEFRDDLMVKCMKALRKFRDGADLEEVISNKKLSSEIEKILPQLKEFATERTPEEVSRVIDALGIFTKAPAPCKMKIISLIETMIGKTTPKG